MRIELIFIDLQSIVITFSISSITYNFFVPYLLLDVFLIGGLASYAPVITLNLTPGRSCVLPGFNNNILCIAIECFSPIT